MAFVERSNKGSGLTAAEMDANFLNAGGNHGATRPVFVNGLQLGNALYHSGDNTYIWFGTDTTNFTIAGGTRFRFSSNYNINYSGAIRPGIRTSSSSLTSWSITPTTIYAQDLITSTATGNVSATINNFTSALENWGLIAIKFRGNLSMTWGSYYKFLGGEPWAGYDAGGNYHIVCIPHFSTGSSTILCGAPRVVRTDG